MSKELILMIDDDEKLANSFKDYLARFNFDLHTALTPSEGLKLLDSNNYSLIVLDGMLPEIDGFEVCKRIRKTSDIPIIMLTGRVEESDIVLGLEYGADDYVTKPFNPREVVARIQRLIKRTQKSQSPVTDSQSKKAANLEIFPEKYEAYLLGENLNLTTQEFDILKCLMNRAHVTLSREEIMRDIHGDDWTAFDRALDIAISRLRKKLSKDKDNEYIKTVWGKGYMFLAETL